MNEENNEVEFYVTCNEDDAPTKITEHLWHHLRSHCDHDNFNIELRLDPDKDLYKVWINETLYSRGSLTETLGVVKDVTHLSYESAFYLWHTMLDNTKKNKGVAVTKMIKVN